MSDATINVKKLSATFPGKAPGFTSLAIDAKTGQVWVVDDTEVAVQQKPRIFKISADGSNATEILFEPATVDNVQLENIALQYDGTSGDLKNVWVTSFYNNMFFQYDVAGNKSKEIKLGGGGELRGIVWHQASGTGWIANSAGANGVIWAFDENGGVLSNKKKSVGALAPWNLISAPDNRIWFVSDKPGNKVGYFDPAASDSNFSTLTTHLDSDAVVFGMAVDTKNKRLWLLDSVKLALTYVSLDATPVAANNVIDLKSYLNVAWDLTCDDVGYLWIPTSEKGGLLQLNQNGDFVANVDVVTGPTPDTDTALIDHIPKPAQDYFVLSDRNYNAPALYKVEPVNREENAAKYSFVISPTTTQTADSGETFTEWTIQVKDSTSGLPVDVKNVVKLELEVSDTAVAAFAGKKRLVIDTDANGKAVIHSLKAATVSANETFDISVTTRGAPPATVPGVVNLSVRALNISAPNDEEAAYVNHDFAHGVTAEITPPTSRPAIHFAIDTGSHANFAGAGVSVDVPVSGGKATTALLHAGAEPETFKVTASVSGSALQATSTNRYVNLPPDSDKYVWSPGAGDSLHAERPFSLTITAQGKNALGLHPVKRASFQLTISYGDTDRGPFTEDKTRAYFRPSNGDDLTKITVMTDASGKIAFGASPTLDLPYTAIVKRSVAHKHVQIKIKPLGIMPDTEKDSIYPVQPML